MIVLVFCHLLALGEDWEEMVEVFLAEEAIPLEFTTEDVLFSFGVL